MASLLVYLDPERLRGLLAPDRRNSGRMWTVDRAHVPEPQLDRLDDDADLFLFTVEHGRAICVAVVEEPELVERAFRSGDALLRDLDITDVLPRLGCTGDIAAWAAIPRILPPGDVDLLRYTLGLANDLVRPPAPPEPLLAGDPTADSLRAAVFADPDADEPRELYADYLMSRGDPRGELVALQLARARTGGAMTDRERVLLERYAKDCVEPFAPYLVHFTLHRGFLHEAYCASDGMMMPDIARHPGWATVATLRTTSHALLASEHVRARRIGVLGNELWRLAAETRPLPFETVVGLEDPAKPRHVSHTGVWIDGGWGTVESVGGLVHLRAISINYASLGDQRIADLLRSPLGSQLEHLDLHINPQQHMNATAIRAAFDGAEIPLVTIRCPLHPSEWRGPQRGAVIAFRRSSREPILTLQVDGVLAPNQLTTLLRVLAPASRGIPRIEVNDLEDPDETAARQAELVGRLELMFHRVVARAGACLAP